MKILAVTLEKCSGCAILIDDDTSSSNNVDDNDNTITHHWHNLARHYMC